MKKFLVFSFHRNWPRFAKIAKIFFREIQFRVTHVTRLSGPPRTGPLQGHSAKITVFLPGTGGPSYRNVNNQRFDSLIRLRGVSKYYGLVSALYRVDLDIEERELVLLTGPSGAGK